MSDHTINLPLDEILALYAIKEAFGGFAHDVVQPINAITLASQLVQLRVGRSGLNEDEKDYILNKLTTINDQVQKTAEIIRTLRDYTNRNRTINEPTEIAQILNKLFFLLGRQLAVRNIEFFSQDLRRNPHFLHKAELAEAILIQAIAFCRDLLSSNLENDTQTNFNPDSRSQIHVQIVNVAENSAVIFSCNPDVISSKNDLTVGLSAAAQLLNKMGGAVEVDHSDLTVVFPPTF